MRFRGRLEQAGQVVEPSITGELTYSQVGGLTQITGYVDCPPGSGLMIGRYRIVLDDGRSLEMEVFTPLPGRTPFRAYGPPT